MITLPNGWHIEYNPKPIPLRQFDYDFWHDDIDIGNNLHGYGSSEADCLNQITEILTNLED